MAFNKVAKYNQMIEFLKNAGYDVSGREHAIDESKISFAHMDQKDLFNYVAALDAVFEARNEYMSVPSIIEELMEVQERLGHSVTADKDDGRGGVEDPPEAGSYDPGTRALVLRGEQDAAKAGVRAPGESDIGERRVQLEQTRDD